MKGRMSISGVSQEEAKLGFNTESGGGRIISATGSKGRMVVACVCKGAAHSDIIRSLKI